MVCSLLYVYMNDNPFIALNRNLENHIFFLCENMEDYIPIDTLFNKKDKTVMNFTIHEKVLSKNKMKYSVYIITDDNKKYVYDEYNLSDKNEYNQLEIDPVNRLITLSMSEDNKESK